MRLALSLTPAGWLVAAGVAADAASWWTAGAAIGAATWTLVVLAAASAADREVRP